MKRQLIPVSFPYGCTDVSLSVSLPLSLKVIKNVLWEKYIFICTYTHTHILIHGNISKINFNFRPNNLKKDQLRMA